MTARSQDRLRVADDAMRSTDLGSFWSWLPAFRVVAEHESLQDASRILRLSPSSISRTIRLLEGELGRPLFCRESQTMRLLPAGRELLSFVRRAMRLVDDGAAMVRGSASGPLRLSLSRTLVPLVAIPTLQRLRGEKGVFHIEHEADEAALTAGFVDLLVVPAPARIADIEVHALGKLELGIYCGREHPLWGAGSATLEELVKHPFVTTADAVEAASWPPDHARTVALRLGDLTAAIDACVASLGLAALPRAAVANRALRCLSSSSLPPVPLYAVRRPRLGENDRLDRLIAALTLTVRGLGSVSAATRTDRAACP